VFVSCVTCSTNLPAAAMDGGESCRHLWCRGSGVAVPTKLADYPPLPRQEGLGRRSSSPHHRECIQSEQRESVEPDLDLTGHVNLFS